jgi:hypothetical protein
VGLEDTFVLLAATVALPLLLLAVRGLFAWRYRRALQRSMGEAGGEPTPASPASATVADAALPRQVLHIRDATPDALSSGARALEATARSVTRRVRVAFTAAALILAVFLGAAVATALAAHIPTDARIVGVYLALGPLVLILVSTLSLPRHQVALAAALYLVVGLAIALVVAAPARAVVLVTAQAELFLLLPAAGLLSRRLRPMLIALVAIALYIAIAFGVGFALASTGLDTSQLRWWLWVVAITYQLLGIAIAGWLLSRRGSVRWPVAALACAAIAGGLIELLWGPEFPIGPLLMGLPSQTLQIFAVWLIFRGAVRLQERRLLPPQVAHSHVAMAFLAAYFILLLIFAGSSSLFGPIGQPIALIVAGFIAYLVVLHALLYPVWKSREPVPGKRLLLLRTFGNTRGPERLLDTLEDTWQRIGRIDLIAATDLAVRALGSRMIEAFIVRRVDAQFLRTPDDVSRRLETLRTAVQGDARYPINDVFCHGDSWQLAVSRLAPESDVVLMDLRGFTRRNRGCVFELTALVRSVPLDRIVLLADRTTDLAAANEIAAAAWSERASVADAGPQQTLTVLRFSGSQTRNAQVLFGLLLEAAVPGPAGPEW